MKTTKLIAAMLVAAFVAIYTPSISLAEEGGSVGGEIFKGGLRASLAGLQQLFDLYTVSDWLLGRTTSSSWALMAFGLTIMLILWKLKRKNWGLLIIFPPLMARFILLFAEADPEVDMGMTALISCLSLLPISLVAFFTWSRGLLFAFNQGGDTIWAKLLKVFTPSPFWYYFKHSKAEKTYGEDNGEEDEDEDGRKPPPKKGSTKLKGDECPKCPKPNKSLGERFCLECGYARPNPTQETALPEEDPPEEEYDPEDLDDD
jgi:hypothetical protein